MRTYEDLLKSPHDEDLFEYYATSQLALVDASQENQRPVVRPGYSCPLMLLPTEYTCS